MLANNAAMCISGYERLTKRLASGLRQPFEAFEGKKKHFKGNCYRLEGVERLGKPVDYNELDDTYLYLRDKSEKFVIEKSAISAAPKCQNGVLKCTFDNWRYWA